jgi:hypothetical protein
MQYPQAKLKEIKRILALWPSQAADDGDELLRAYLLAVDDYHADDVTNAVDLMVKGIAPGINPGFRPKPSEVGAECRRQLNMRVDRENQHARLHPRLPPPAVQHTPASRAAIKAMVDQAVANLTAASPAADRAERHRRIIAKTNERFDKDPWFEVGDPEDAADAA